MILLGAFTKSHSFLSIFGYPNAMATPTPVSAYLHSAYLWWKAGIFSNGSVFYPALADY